MAADDTESLVLAISADVTQIRRALKSLQDDSKNTANQIKTNFDSINTKNPFQQFAADFTKSSRQMENEARVLSFQINDITTGLLSGGDAARIFAQQAGQISQSFSNVGGGLGSGLNLLKTSLLGMLNPINLIIGAFGLALYAADKFYNGASDEAKVAEKALEDQAAAIKRLADAYGTAIPVLKQISDEVQAQLKARQDSADTALLEQKAYGDLDQVWERIADTLDDVKRSADPFDPQKTYDVIDAVEALEKAFKDHKLTADQVGKVYDSLKALGTDAASKTADAIRDKLLPALADTVSKARRRPTRLGRCGMACRSLAPCPRFSPVRSALALPPTMPPI